MSRQTSTSPGRHACWKTWSVASPLRTCSTRPSEAPDGLARERVDALVQRVARVAAHLVPDDVVAARLAEDSLPEIAVRHGLLLAVPPAGLLPALPPALAEAVDDVGAVRVDVDAPPARDGGEALCDCGELHALVRRVGFGAGDDPLGVAIEDERRPASRPGIPGAGAVGVQREVGERGGR